MNQRRVNVITKYFYPVAAGIEHNIMQTYSVLAKDGWDVTIHTSKDDYQAKNSLPDIEVINGLKVKRYSFNTFGFFPELPWLDTDFVCLHNFDIFPHLRILLHVLWLKVIGRKNFALTLTPHGGFNPEWRIYGLLQKIIKFTYSYTIGTLLINLTVDGSRAVSEWERVEMIKKGVSSRKVRTIANGLENEAFTDPDLHASSEIKKKVSEFGTYIVQIGRVYGIKNYEPVIKSLTELPGVNFVIIGPVQDAEYKAHLEALISELGLSGRVHFIGIVRSYDKYYVLKHALAMTHMALWESFCNVVYEALSQGLVSIVSNSTALPYLVKEGETGFLLNENDTAGIVEKIKFIQNPQNLEKLNIMRMNMKNFTQDHTWEKVGRKMGDFYLELKN